jgi:carboxypeptidase C (cathepsin A)
MVFLLVGTNAIMSSVDERASQGSLDDGAQRFYHVAMRNVFCLVAFANVIAIISPLARAEPPTSAPATQPGSVFSGPGGPDKLSVSEGSITVDGKPLKYRATAGRIGVRDETDKPKADFFFVAYERLPADEDPSKRPITFVFNGGPGAASVWLHLGAVGPRRVALDHDTDLPVVPYHLEENPDTWLAATDLVFIDPVGTGYSRAAQGEKPEQFFGVTEDIHWVAEFIRLYTTRYQRWLSPKYLAGESYGTTRAAGLSDYLQQSDGIGLNGIILISSVLTFGTIEAGAGNDLPYELYLPSYAAVAWYHHKLAPDLQADLQKTIAQAEQWSTETYGPALAKDASLSADERAAINHSLVRFTGLPLDFVEKADLRIRPDRFEGVLLADQRKVIGRFDARLTGFNPEPLDNSTPYDPSLQPYLSAYTATFNDYVRRTLKYENDMTYEVLTGRVQPWNMGPAGNGYLDVSHTLTSAMTDNPRLRVMFVSGYFDLATPFAAANYTIDHMDLSAELRKHIIHNFYEGGHMVYHHRPTLTKLGQDVRAFVSEPE